MAFSRLAAAIDAHKATHGISDAELARRIGVSRENLRLWRTNGLRRLPDRDNLAAVARVIGKPYREILNAALLDTGYLADVDVEPPALYRDLLYATLGAVTTAVPPVVDGQSPPRWEDAYAAQAHAIYLQLSEVLASIEKRSHD